MCSPNTCHGGTCSTTTVTTCICPPNWRHQWTWIKADCSTPQYLLEVAAAIHITFACFVFVKSLMLLHRKARGTTKRTVQTLVICQIFCILWWICLFIEGGFFAATIGMLIAYFLCVYRLVDLFLEIVFLPALGMKPSSQALALKGIEMFTAGLGVVTIALLVPAIYFANIGDLETVNNLLAGFQLFYAVSTTIFGLGGAFGAYYLQVTFGGSAEVTSHDELVHSVSGESSPISAHHAARTSKEMALARLQKMKIICIIRAATVIPIIVFVAYYFTNGTAPGFDIYAMLFMIQQTFTHSQLISQLVPTARDHEETMGSSTVVAVSG